MPATGVREIQERPLRIALVAPPFVRVPPRSYGGTELIVSELAGSLCAAGHEVTLFATGDSRVEGCSTRWLFPEPRWPPEPAIEREHATYVARTLAEERFDVVHSHTPALLPLLWTQPHVVVHTIHHVAEHTSLGLYRSHGYPRYVCISHRQAALMTGIQAQVIHHGLDVSRYPFGHGESGYALFLGRLDEVKGPHFAVRAAREAGLPLRLAGRPHDGDYFDRVLRPEMEQGGVEWLGELGGGDKLQAIGSARVLLFPSTWEEPFGLALIEAMLCGTPVVALRRGSAPELVDEGVTGHTVDTPEDLSAAIHRVVGLDRRRVQERAVERFSHERMTGEYVRLYLASIAEAGASSEVALQAQ